MATSNLRIRFEAWANRIFLNGAAASISSEKLAAGMVLFMAQRKLMALEFGEDYLLALPCLSEEESSYLLLNFKGMYVQMQRSEKELRAVHGNDFYERVFSDAEPDPLAYRIAASLAIQLISAHLAPQAQLGVMRSIHGIVKSAMPKIVVAHQAALQARDNHAELSSILGMEPDAILDSLHSITTDELLKPLAPPPAWMVTMLASSRS